MKCGRSSSPDSQGGGDGFCMDRDVPEPGEGKGMALSPRFTSPGACFQEGARSVLVHPVLRGQDR